MTIDGVNVLTSLNQDITSELTGSISSESYLVSKISTVVYRMNNKT